MGGHAFSFVEGSGHLQGGVVCVTGNVTNSTASGVISSTGERICQWHDGVFVQMFNSNGA